MYMQKSLEVTGDQSWFAFFSIRGLQPVLQCLQRAHKILPLLSTQIFPWQIPKHMTLRSLLNPSALKDEFHRISLMLLWSVFIHTATSPQIALAFFKKSYQDANDIKFSVPLLVLPKFFWSSSLRRSHVWALECKSVGSR